MLAAWPKGIFNAFSEPQNIRLATRVKQDRVNTVKINLPFQSYRRCLKNPPPEIKQIFADFRKV
jgi:hypothetical protein